MQHKDLKDSTCLSEQHDYELYLAVNDIDHTKTKAASPQTNGICERFHKTILQEFYQTNRSKNLLIFSAQPN
ncbi:hypothetical protein CEX83_03365 [Acinetobacter baumannii]|nr:hypothetical protein CEX83_03365 [Acinetobacter baumannii]PHM86509.1 hypothetical protein CHH39_01900 [Acinetobacter baumannii]PHM90171.1 hypothetical protein CHH37_01130 [Acinetobacter baumannii]